MWGAGEQGKLYPRTGWSWDNLTASRCVTRAVREVGGVPEWDGPEHERGLLTKEGSTGKCWGNDLSVDQGFGVKREGQK